MKGNPIQRPPSNQTRTTQPLSAEEQKGIYATVRDLEKHSESIQHLPMNRIGQMLLNDPKLTAKEIASFAKATMGNGLTNPIINPLSSSSSSSSSKRTLPEFYSSMPHEELDDLEIIIQNLVALLESLLLSAVRCNK